MKERKKESMERQNVSARVRKITKERKEKRKKIIKMMIFCHCVIYLFIYIYFI
jgi:cell division septal protein FtsQ